MFDMSVMQPLVKEHAQLILMTTVFLEQLGLPIPAYPSLVLAGALLGDATDIYALANLLAAVVSACLAADILWFFAGRRFGGALTRKICQLSMSPEQCVARSGKAYERVGAPLLLVAKFLPGAGAITTLMAGAHGTSLRKFVLYDIGGATIWSASAICLGYAFQDAVLNFVETARPYIALVLLALIGAAAIAIAGAGLSRRH